MISTMFGPELEVAFGVGCSAATSAAVGEGSDVSDPPTPLPNPALDAFPPEESDARIFERRLSVVVELVVKAPAFEA
jgi:hypothetical protein